MKIKLLISFLLLGLVSLPNKGTAQDSLKNAKTNYKFGIGAGAGYTTGLGLSFRYTPSKFGMQVNFAPYKDGNTERYSAGLTFLYKLNEGKNVNLFLYQANHYFYRSTTDYYFSYPYGPYYNPYSEKRTEEYMNNGVGFGFEFLFLKRMSFNLMAGYASFNNFKELKLTAETGLYFKF